MRSHRLTILALMLAVSSAHGIEKPEAHPIPRLDSRFIALTAASLGLTLWDAAQTRGCLVHVPGCYERNPLYGPYPSASRIYGQSLAITGAAAILSYELRRHGPQPLRHIWTFPVVGVTAGHAFGIAMSPHGYTPRMAPISDSGITFISNPQRKGRF